MPLKPLYLWLIALNGMSLLPFTFGPLSFVCLLISALILWRLLPQTASISPLETQPMHKPLIGLAYISIGITIISSIVGLVYQPQWLINLGGIIDIAANTYAATDAFAQGLNPYTTRSQLWVTQFPADTPHMENINGQITMYGVPYFHGYPYFPLMLLSYLPAYFIFEGYTAIRVTHIVLMLLNITAFKLLIDKLLPHSEQRRTALLIAITAYLGVLRYSVEAVLLGVTDMLISTYLLYCFVALSQHRYAMAGILLGCAQACKLLPAPLVFLGIAWMLYHNKGHIGGLLPLWRFLGGFIVACIVIILPFIIWHPEGFLSSTILYYLTHHKGGDITSLWSFLPDALKTPFLFGGLILTLVGIVAFAQRDKSRPEYSLVACMAGSYASYVLFMSFSKMTHLNYLWGVFPLGCVALAITILSAQEKQNQFKH